MSTVAPQRRRAPIEVYGACVANIIASAVAFAIHVLSRNYDSRHLALDVSVVVVLTALIIWGLLGRQNWLRWLLVVAYAIGAAIVALGTLLKGIIFQPLLYLHAAIQCTTLVLLLVPDSAAWFSTDRDDDDGA